MPRYRENGWRHVRLKVPTEVLEELAALKLKTPPVWHKNEYRNGLLIHEALKLLNARSPVGFTIKLEPEVDRKPGHSPMRLVPRESRED